MHRSASCNQRSICFGRGKFLLPVLLLLSVPLSYSFSQSPGGISTSLTAWFKANTSNTANLVLNGSGVAQWTSEVNNFSVTQATASHQPFFINTAIASNNFNFNPSVQFDVATTRSLNNTNSLPDLLGTNGTLFLVVNTNNYAAGSNSCFAYTSNYNYRYQAKAHWRIQTGNNGIGYTADFNPQFPTDYGDAAGRILVSRSTGTDFYSKRNGDIFPINNVSTGYLPAVNIGLCIGSDNNSGQSEYSNSAIAEVITYNTKLAETDINKVETYLAIKYGITLSQSTAYNNNYTSSNGTIVWNRNANSAYASNITGIGRDNGAGLLQKQSKSVNTNGIVSMYNGNTAGVFPDMNAGNTSSLAVDQSFLLFGDNGAALTLGACANGGKTTRISRIWKVQKTGTLDTVTLAVNTAAITAQVKAILVSADPAFPAGATTTYGLSVSPSRLYAPVSLHDGDYFTFATDSVAAPVVNGITVCADSIATLTIQNPQAGVSYNWYTVATGGTAINTGTSYTIPGLTTTTTYYVDASSVTGCTRTPRTAVTVTVNPTIAQPDVSASQVSITSITFSWAPVPGATGYMVSVNGGAYQLPSSGAGGLSHTISGLSAGTTVSIQVIALGVSNCQNSNPGTASATTLNGKVFIPNAFSPNADGTNDVFLVYANQGTIAGLDMKIFNQWGELVFESSDQGRGWDGTYKGKAQPCGVYMYVIKIQLAAGGEIIRKGSVNLVK